MALKLHLAAIVLSMAGIFCAAAATASAQDGIGAQTAPQSRPIAQPAPVYDRLIAYIEGIEAIAGAAQTAQDDQAVCADIARKLNLYAEKHADFRRDLGYAADRIGDGQISEIMAKASEIGKKLAGCFGNPDIRAFLARMQERE